MGSKVISLLFCLLSFNVSANVHMIGLDPSFLWGGDMYFSYKTDLGKKILIGGGYESTQVYEDDFVTNKPCPNPESLKVES